jgi:hypothetical protein
MSLKLFFGEASARRKILPLLGSICYRDLREGARESHLRQGAEWWQGNRRRRRYNRPRTSPSPEMAPKIAKGRSSSACSPAHFCNRAASPSPHSSLDLRRRLSRAANMLMLLRPRDPSSLLVPPLTILAPPQPSQSHLISCAQFPTKESFYLPSAGSVRNNTNSIPPPPPPPPSHQICSPLFLELVSKLRRQFSRLPGRRKSRYPTPSAASLILYLLSLFF